MKLFVVLLCFGLMACATSKTFDARSNDSSDDPKVTSVQQLLDDWSYYDGANIGVLDCDTTAAILAFQTD